MWDSISHPRGEFQRDPRTPLWYAVDAGKVQVVQKLLQHGAPADIGFDPSRAEVLRIRWGMDAAFVTPLYHRLRKDGCRETLPIARLLLAHGASFDREHRIFDHTRPRDFYHVDTPLSLVRFFRTAHGMPEVNELFDAYGAALLAAARQAPPLSRRQRAPPRPPRRALSHRDGVLKKHSSG